jgi:hypothetical protein
MGAEHRDRARRGPVRGAALCLGVPAGLRRDADARHTRRDHRRLTVNRGCPSIHRPAGATATCYGARAILSAGGGARRCLPVFCRACAAQVAVCADATLRLSAVAVTKPQRSLLPNHQRGRPQARCVARACARACVSSPVATHLLTRAPRHHSGPGDFLLS